MDDVTITLKNYRCFSDNAPAVFRFGRGLTAVVGPNHSGKSALLRVIYELRDFLAGFSGPNALQSLAVGNAFGVVIRGVDDPLELFSDQNDRPLSVDISFENPRENEIARIHLTADRSSPTNWKGAVFVGPKLERATGGSNSAAGSGFILPVNREQPVDFTRVFAFTSAVAKSMYIGPHRNAVNQGAGEYFDLAIGTSFISQWNTWKTGTSKRTMLEAQGVVDDIARIFGFKRLEVNATEGNRDLQVIVDSKPYKLREVGAGISQFLVVLASVAMRQPSLLLIDEPELHLHPSLQAKFCLELASRSSQGVIFSTHSIGLARAVSERVYTISRADERSSLRPFEATPDPAALLSEMSFSAWREAGFDHVLLVEGVTDVLTFQAFLRKLRLDHRVVVLPMGGDQFFGKDRSIELAELARLAPKVAVIIDSERAAKDAAISDQRASFLAKCRELGFSAHATELRATENYLSDDAIKSTIGADHSALAPFERLRDRRTGWSKSDNWRAAREMSIADIESTDIAQFLFTAVPV